MWIVALALLAVGAAVAGGAGFQPDVVTALRTEKHIYVATRRADGQPSKAAPVWFTFDGDAVLFTTAPDSYKVRRIRKGSPVTIAVGTADGPSFTGTAELVQDPELATKMGVDYDRKYWISWMGLFRPRAERVRTGKTIIVRIRPA